MRTLIERLVASGNAYVAEDNVLFSVPSMPDYGRLSKRPLDEMIAGARVEVAPYKRDAMDFVLWKPSKPGEPAWPSPAGIKTPGRPGWHIECSAMSWKHLGETFDIHGGGIDLVFPHHENEIAQSRCAFHTPVMANYWMHNGFLQVEGEKMSKSLGNFVTIRELLTSDWLVARCLRLAMLRTHYRQPIRLDGCRLARGAKECSIIGMRCLATWRYRQRKLRARMCSRRCRRSEHAEGDRSACTTLRERNCGHSVRHSRLEPKRKLKAIGLTSGIVRRRMREHSHARNRVDMSIDEATAKVASLIAARNDAARKAKDFKESDRIRDELAKMGVVLKDSKDGTTWEIAR